MKLLIHDYAGHGFIAELSRELVSRGHTIIHVYGDHTPSPKGYVLKLPGDPDELIFHPIRLSALFKKYSYFRRWIQEHQYGRLLAKVVLEYQPDIVISAQTPLDAEAHLDRVCKSENVPIVHWLQDVIGVASYKILSRRILIFGGLIGLYYQLLEKRLLRRASSIITITEDFNSILHNWGISSDKICIIPNWPPLSYLPVLEKNNNWSQANSLTDNFVFLYTGTLGYKHNPVYLSSLAQEFLKFPKVKIVVVSEGPGANFLKKKIAKEGIDNLFVYPYQPPDKYAEVLATGDVLVGILEKDAGVFSVPSKVLSYLCAQRPLLLSIPLENKAAKIVLNNKAGIVVSPNSLDEFLTGGKKLLNDRLLRDSFAENGRQYILDNFNIKEIGNKFEVVLKDIVLKCK